MKITRQDIGRTLFSPGLNMRCHPVVSKVTVHDVRPDVVVIKSGKILIQLAESDLYPTRAECKRAIEQQGRLF